MKSRRMFLVVREELTSGMSQRRGLCPPPLPSPGALSLGSPALASWNTDFVPPEWLLPSYHVAPFCRLLSPPFALFSGRRAGRWPGSGRKLVRGLQPLCSSAPLLPQLTAWSLPDAAQCSFGQCRDLPGQSFCLRWSWPRVRRLCIYSSLLGPPYKIDRAGNTHHFPWGNCRMGKLSGLPEATQLIMRPNEAGNPGHLAP